MTTYRKKLSIRRRKPKSKSGVVSDSVKKYVKSVTKKALPEMKFAAIQAVSAVEATIALDGVIAGNNWLEFANILQGLTKATRTGNEIKLQGYHSKITYHNNSTVPVYIRRLVIGIEGNDVDAGTNLAELFTINGAGVDINTMGNGLAVIQTPINMSKYKVYFDKVIKLGPAGSTDGPNLITLSK